MIPHSLALNPRINSLTVLRIPQTSADKVHQDPYSAKGLRYHLHFVILFLGLQSAHFQLGFLLNFHTDTVNSLIVVIRIITQRPMVVPNYDSCLNGHTRSTNKQSSRLTIVFCLFILLLIYRLKFEFFPIFSTNLFITQYINVHILHLMLLPFLVNDVADIGLLIYFTDDRQKEKDNRTHDNKVNND